MKPSVLGSTRQPPVLYFEYARMLVMMHAVFIGVACLLSKSPPAATVVGIGASAWVALRAARAVKWHWCFLPVTWLLLWLMASVTGHSAESTALVGYGLFSCRIVMVLLALIGCVDLVETGTRLHRMLQTPERQARIHTAVTERGLQILKWGTFSFVLVCAVLVPLVEEAIFLLSPAADDPNFEMDRLTLLQNILFRFCEAMTGILFFVLGCCVGSFMNVVIYRVPLGMSVLTKASHCPQCSQEIESRDNLPLIGWLKLQGKCRNCGTEISSRYPLVELTTGLLFLLLYFVELISGGANLAGRLPNTYVGVLWILFYTKWDLVGLYVLHCFVFCALLCWTMMQRDQQRVPIRTFLTTATLVVAAVVIWPHLLPFVPQGRSSATWSAQLTAVIGPLLSGAAAGLVAAVLLRRLFRIPQHPYFLVLAGLVLGWQSIVMISLLCVAAKLILLLTMVLSDTDSAVTSPAHGLPTGSGEQDEGTPGSAAVPLPAGTPTATAVALYWWLLPAMLLIHHCLWRQMASFL